MNILMVTNTFAPNISGVARSVTLFTQQYRSRGHRVLVVAPEFDGAPEREVDVVRVGALRNFAGTDYSVVIGPPLYLARAVDAFRPDIIHSHGPFLLGMTAARLARTRRVPLVFTHHTLYEHYTHYVPGDSGLMKRIAINRGTRYANVSDAVFAPSRSILELLRRRGVTVPIYEVPTGVPLSLFANGDGAGFRAHSAFPPMPLSSARSVGWPRRRTSSSSAAPGPFPRRHTACSCADRRRRPVTRADGGDLRRSRVTGRVSSPAPRAHRRLVDAYHAMNVFAFASLTETQGLVLAEAMAAGVAVVAVDAPGAREIVRDGANGRLLAQPMQRPSMRRWIG